MKGVAVAPGAGQRALVTEVVKATRHDDGQQLFVLELAMPGLDEIWTVEIIADTYAILPDGPDGLHGARSVVLELVPRPAEPRVAA